MTIKAVEALRLKMITSLVNLEKMFPSEAAHNHDTINQGK